MRQERPGTLVSSFDKDEEDEQDYEEEEEKESLTQLTLTIAPFKILDLISVITKMDCQKYVNFPNSTLLDLNHWMGEVDFLKDLV